MSLDTLERRSKSPIRFGDLPVAVREIAEHKLRRLASRYPTLPNWRLGVLTACVRRHLVSPLTSDQARRMLAKRAGLASQRSYRLRGIFDPLKKARRVQASKRKSLEPAPPVRLAGSYDPNVRDPRMWPSGRI